jgi:hypothetical protein
MCTRSQDRPVDEIAARASKYLEGESGAEEFRERLLRAITYADEDALIFSPRPSPTTPKGWTKDGTVPAFALAYL